MFEQWMDSRPMVGALAKMLARRGVTAEELFVAGLFGLYQASLTYDSTRGASFNTYAKLRVIGEMKDFKKAVYGDKGKHRLTRRIPAETTVRDRDLAAVDARDELEGALRAGVTIPVRAPLPEGGTAAVGKRLRLGNECMSQRAWARRLGVAETTLCERIKKWGVERALATPKQRSGRRPWKRDGSQ